MNNKIVYVTKNEAQLIKADAVQNREIYFAEIDGAIIKAEEDYVRAMAEAFAFPHKLPEMKLGWYNDYINDLMWIEQKEIVLIINNYDLMLVDDLKLKNDIMADFEEIILPWWEEEVVGHMVGGVPRKFMVYLENLQESQILFHMGNYLNLCSKWYAEATQALTGIRECCLRDRQAVLCMFSYFSLFLIFGITRKWLTIMHFGRSKSELANEFVNILTDDDFVFWMKNCTKLY